MIFPVLTTNHQLTIEEAKKALEWVDANVSDLSDEAQEFRDMFAWRIKNAHKLRTMFFGNTDSGSIEDMNAAWMALAMKLGDTAESPSPMLH